MRDFEQPGRSLAAARSGMAATSHPAATLAAIDILRQGGNALDAAIGAVAVQGVVEPGSTGIGGDCFALLSKGGSADIIAYNGAGRAPAAATIDRFRQLGVECIDGQSVHSVTVPGAVEAWGRLVADHGRLDLGAVLQPAIALARDGYAITPRVAYDLRHAVGRLSADKAASEIFLAEGRALEFGQLHSQPRLASTLEAIGRDGPDAFYRGTIAEAMVETLQDRGGLHELEDFASTQGEYVKPISSNFRGRQVHECPPNGQGVIALLIMNILSRFTLKGDPLGIDNLHLEIEAARLAYAARNRFLGDTPNAGAATVTHLLSDRFADELAARIDPKGRALNLPSFEDVVHKDTVYVCVVDKDRNAVSLINSLFSGYGSGIACGTSGVLFHNRGQSFSLESAHPNAIAPRKRPMHTIIPAMVSEGGRVSMPFGVMGGHYQAMGHAYFLSRLFDHDLDMQSAMALPRLFPLPGTRIVEVEQALLVRHGAELERRGFEVRAAARPIGGAQAIRIDWANGSLIGASDPRKDGCALGW
ncbi:gamma-glutamyltransferase family protein [Bosea sp. BIWAKO-01]|uniref:gamma-glutamyltransferase family protein n=1 Tax=Bosea sp. BIWAKO-01 TaxID=506668 RepID=UPI000852E215|nr:gamma-glutamyltransferase family protein [Bosea sp. BIWAKO-01]